ncbi:hypothetical protein [Bifidobacterium imperatoris]|nr:hypothetical protein [Bifidobacterium imperatoris]
MKGMGARSASLLFVGYGLVFSLAFGLVLLWLGFVGLFLGRGFWL